MRTLLRFTLGVLAMALAIIGTLSALILGFLLFVEVAWPTHLR